MKKLPKGLLLLYGCSGLGVNMLNMIMGSYLVSALHRGLIHDKAVGFWTYLDADIIILGVWWFIGFFAKALDGIIDLPFATFADKLKTKLGRRKTGILIGFIPMLISFILFLIIPFDPGTLGTDIANTIWFGVLLCTFYTFYTLTMLTYYATFSEVCRDEKDMTFLSNTKSICDVVYMSLVYALFPVFIDVLRFNVRDVAAMFLPLALTMLIPFFLLKEKPNEQGEIRTLTLKSALSTSFKNKAFIYWMFTCAVTTIGLQLFLGGINEVFTNIEGLSMTAVMASSFAPVPFTIILYNHIIKKKGLGFAYRYVLTIFAAGMAVMLACLLISNLNNISPIIEPILHESIFDALKFVNDNRLAILYTIAIIGGIMVSFSLGAFFSVTYMVPSRLAQIEYNRSGNGVSGMFFAVQGLFEGIAAGIATGIILSALKEINQIWILPVIVIICCIVAFVMSLKFAPDVAHMGKND